MGTDILAGPVATG